MKKLLIILSTFISLLFFGCYSETGVLYNIRGDVKSETAEVSGNIRTITRYTANGQEFLVLIGQANRTDKKRIYSKNYDSTEIFYKPLSSSAHGEWLTYNKKPCSDYYYDFQTSTHHGQQLLLTHADENTLYVVTAEYENDSTEGNTHPSKFHIWAKQISVNANGLWDEGGTWVDILDDGTGKNYFPIYKDKNNFYHSAFSLFSTNSVKKEHRKVYLRSGDADISGSTVTYYEISGLNPPSSITVQVSDSTTVNNANSAVYFNNSNIGDPSNGGYKFFNAMAATTNETASSDATMLYYGNDQYVYYMSATDTEAQTNNAKTGVPISALAVCKDALLVGRADFNAATSSGNGGITKFTLDSNGIPASVRSSFDTNAELQLSPSYLIMTLLNTDPSLNEKDSTLYSSITFLDVATNSSINAQNVGLWSYYKNRGNWNRE